MKSYTPKNTWWSMIGLRGFHHFIRLFSSHSDLPDAVPSTRISLDLFGTNLVSGERYDDEGKNKVLETVRKGWIRPT